MAKIPQGILGGIRGKVGNVVGAAWKGINYIRSMPLSVANPNTTAQQAQRGAFTQVVLVARLLLADLIATYWDPFARAMSGYNHFISINIDAFVTAGLEDTSKFFSARGILTGITGQGLVGSEAGGDLDLTWVDNSGSGDALATDLIRIVWYNETQDYWGSLLDSEVIRSAAALNIPDALVVEEDFVKGFAFFARPDTSKISDSELKTVQIGA